ncbi:MAG: type I-E CRISPR-associated protein Cas6/Cse3/CasE [Dehalococcoidia bacterium]|nr:type I-E CRISPR-associated protein Cas6/Cse3/CasE [Dehalococcoidia bacterium]
MMQPLQMVRAEISQRDFQRWMGMRRLQDPDHGMHCLLTECFGRDLAPRPFRAIFPRGGSRGCLYGYGLAVADELREAAGAYADPLQCRIIPPQSIDSKPMPEQWTAGKRLGFEVRVRPIVRRTDKADTRPGKEWDAFQLEAEQHSKGKMTRSREEVYTDWLRKQLESRGGAALESATLASFQRTRAVRRLRGTYSEGPDALMRGVLEITDGPAFAKLLAGGVGRHRAYGYGMLLLRPASGKPGS